MGQNILGGSMPLTLWWNLIILAFQIIIGIVIWKCTHIVGFTFFAVFLISFMALAIVERDELVVLMVMAAGFAAGVPSFAFVTGDVGMAILTASVAVGGTVFMSYCAACEASRRECGTDEFQWKYFAQVFPVVGATLGFWHLTKKFRRTTFMC